MGKFSQKIVAEYNPPRKWIMEEPLSYITDLDETELRCLELVGVEVRGKKITVEIMLLNVSIIFNEIIQNIKYSNVDLMLKCSNYQ